MDGHKLPPLIIYKGQPNGWIVHEFVGSAAVQNGYPAGQVYTVQQKSWVDSRVFSIWINSVWSPFCTGVSDSTYLIMDEFSVHRTLDSVQAIQEFGLDNVGENWNAVDSAMARIFGLPSLAENVC